MTARSKSRPDRNPAASVPQSVADCEGLIGDIHRLRQTLKANADALDTHICELKDRAARQAAPLEAEIERLTVMVQAFCDARRDALTDGRRSKTVRFSNGTVTWRLGKARVRLDADEKDILLSLREMKLKKFIRVSEEIDKAEMLRAPAQARTVPGVTILDAIETFSVEPQGDA